jgi:ribosome-associated protein
MLEINERLSIPAAEFQWTFVRAGGPGGQNVNKVASKAVLRWNVAGSPSVPEDVKARLLAHHRKQTTTEGEMVLSSQRFRDQERNRQDCLDKLSAWIRQAAMPPRPRRPTKPTRGSRQRRLEEKKHRGQIKAARRQKNEE